MSSDISLAWLSALDAVLASGRLVSPRGQLTKELAQFTLEVDMRRPVLLVPERKLSYQFMAAEAYWILTADETVAGIAPWNPRIADFSDDGKVFYGAYGPRIHEQLNYVLNKLLEDPDTRQAGLTIWRPNPPPTRDPPCTITIFFGLRGGLLNTHVFMRSNDQWLGLPYDVFNFSMLAHLVCARYNTTRAMALRAAAEAKAALERQAYRPFSFRPLAPGTLYLTAASSHLYEQHWELAKSIVASEFHPVPMQPTTPIALFHDEQTLLETLRDLRNTKRYDTRRWWEHQ